ncbi:hypothetical protein SAMN02745166_04828, partial [Prosthecobacter debontii]
MAATRWGCHSTGCPFIKAPRLLTKLMRAWERYSGFTEAVKTHPEF